MISHWRRLFACWVNLAIMLTADFPYLLYFIIMIGRWSHFMSCFVASEKVGVGCERAQET
jgi:hypothetical protein